VLWSVLGAVSGLIIWIFIIEPYIINRPSKGIFIDPQSIKDYKNLSCPEPELKSKAFES